MARAAAVRICVILALLSTPIFAQQRCPPGYVAPPVYTGRCYRAAYSASGMTWDAALSNCESTGGTLAAITNGNDWYNVWDTQCAYQIPNSRPGTWIGLYNWRWKGASGECWNAATSSWRCWGFTDYVWTSGEDTSYIATAISGAMWIDNNGPEDGACIEMWNSDDGANTQRLGDQFCTRPEPYACCQATYLPTPSNTRTPSNTASNTATRTTTATQTASSSNTATASQTSSSTNTGTSTQTSTRTATATRTMTSSRSVSPTRSVTPSVTESVTPSMSVSPSASTSVSESTSPSTSPSSSSSVSETASPSATVSESPSVSVTTSASVSVSESVSASASVSPSASESVSPSQIIVPAVVGGNAFGIGAGFDVNGTAALIAAEETTNGIVVMAGAGVGALIAIIAALCCLWWCLLLPARRRKEEAMARRKKLSRPTAFARSARNLGGADKKRGGLAGALELSTPGKPSEDPAAAGSLGKRPGAGGARSAFGPSGLFEQMNPALLKAKRPSMAVGAGAATPAVAARAPRMTMALSSYKRSVAAFKPTGTATTSSGGRKSMAAWAAEDPAVGLADDEEAAVGDGSGWNNGGYGEEGADAGASGNYDYSGYEGYDEHGNYIGDGTNYDYTGYEGGYDAPAEDYQDADAPLDDDADADDYMDEDEAILGIAGKKAAGKKVTGGGYLSRNAKKAAPAASMPSLPEPKKLVIGKGTLVSEKVETQVVKLRRVSKIKGDSTLTEMRKQSSRITRPSAAVTSGFGPTAAGSSRNLLDTGSSSTSAAGGAYTFAATVARFKVKADTARSAAAAKRGSVAAKRMSMAAPRGSVAVPRASVAAAAAAPVAEYAADGYGGEYGTGYEGEYAADGTGYEGEYAADGTGYEGEYAADGTGYEGEYAGDGAGYEGEYAADGTGYEGEYAADGTGYEGEYAADGTGYEGEYAADGTGYEGEYAGDGAGYEGEYAEDGGHQAPHA